MGRKQEGGARRHGGRNSASPPGAERSGSSGGEGGLDGERVCQDRENAALTGFGGSTVVQHLFLRVCVFGFTQGPLEGNKHVTPASSTVLNTKPLTTKWHSTKIKEIAASQHTQLYPG